MLALKISDKFVDLPNDFAFTMNLKSPIFGDVGNYSYPFRIPATPRNATILGFPHRVENTGDHFQDFPGSFEWNGITLFCGTAKLKAMNGKSYEGSIFDGSGDFYYQLKNRNLQQVDMGSKDFASEADGLFYLCQSSLNSYPAFPLACPHIVNNDYFDPPTDNEELKKYNFNYSTSPALNYFLLNTLNTYERTIIVPMLYLRHVLEKLAQGLGYTLDDQMFSSHADFNRLVLYNSVSCNNGINDPLPREPEGYSPQHLIFNYHVPRLKINDFLKGLENYFGLALFVDSTTKTVRIIPLKNIVLNPEYVEFSRNIISVSVEKEETSAGYLLSMSLDEDDAFMANQIGYEQDLISRFAGSVKTIADLPQWPIGEILSVYYVENINEYYEMSSGKVWQLSSMASLFTKFLFRDGSEKIDSGFSTIWLISQVGNKMTNYRKVTPRLMFTYNYTDPVTNRMYCQSSTDNFSLLYPGQTGLFNMHWKDFLNFRVGTKLVKIQKQMDFREIHDFDFSKKYMIGGTKYLVKSLQVTIKKDRIMPALLECYVCQ